jgi:hypothetical protein
MGATSWGANRAANSANVKIDLQKKKESEQAIIVTNVAIK